LKTILLMLVLLAATVSAVPLAVIDSQYVSYSNDVLAPAWQIHLRGDRSSDYIKFINNVEVKGEVNGQAVQAQESFTLSSTIGQESCVYNLIDTPQRIDIYQYEYKKVGSSVTSDQVNTLSNQCSKDSSCLYQFHDRKLIPWQYDVYQVFKRKVAIAGDVSGGKMKFEAKFTIGKENGESVSTSINTLLSAEKDVPGLVVLKNGDEVVGSVRWIGGVTYGEFCPPQSDVVSIQRNNVWYTGNKDRYTEYLIEHGNLGALFEEMDDIIIQNKQPSSEKRDELQTKINRVNSLGSAATNPYSMRIANSIATNQGATSVIELPNDYLIYAPDFMVSVRADFLKIVYLVGKPKILKAEFSKCDESAMNNEIWVTMQNVGASTGKFNVGVTCNPSLNIAASIRSLTLGPDETGTFKLPFSVDLKEDGVVNCVASVADVTLPSNKDSASFNHECLSSKLCKTEGEVFCQGSVQYKCVSGDWVPQPASSACTTKCNQNGKCEASLNESFEICGGKLSSVNDCATCNFDEICDLTETVYSCKSDCASSPDNTLIWIIGGIAAAFAVYLVYQNMTKKKGRRR
jgi:hypothetical protein